MSNLTRRDILSGAVAVVGASAVNAHAAMAPTPALANRRRVMRVAHLTDTHIQPERRASEGFAACLRHVQSVNGTVDLILAGGDNVMDVMGKNQARGEAQLSLWKSVLRGECSLPVEHCVGNHDVWGWNKEKSQTTGDEPLWGKKWALDAFEIPKTYRTFDRAGWRFIVLDSTHPDKTGNSYIARLDDEQFEWLAEVLLRTPATMPVLVLSHIPIISACSMFDGENEKTGDWLIPGSWMHIDARRIKDLFKKYPNVKVCLSGHIHLVDRVEYLGVTYLCNGAVSGGWWKGANQECEPGYGLIDLFDDGTFDSKYVTYGWVVAKEDKE